ncbi:hypothetical protein JW826_06490 [Candidatus Woesearchaeota archaeon]|nr:hypothetical protein [Candidatus Woesearchaeota archaeon]
MGIFLAITVLFLIFARDQLEILLGIVWAFVVIGIVALIVAHKSSKQK